ncbi:type II toxin-antitoxin system VapC family toxin [Gordonia sp. NPDC003422]
MRRVVDASALVDAVLPSARQAAALRSMSGYELWAPTILDMEALSAIWRLQRTSQISSAEAERAVKAVWTAPIRRVESVQISSAAWDLRTSVRVSDAFYVATARFYDADLITSDARLSRSPDIGVPIVVLPQ